MCLFRCGLDGACMRSSKNHDLHGSCCFSNCFSDAGCADDFMLDSRGTRIHDTLSTHKQFIFFMGRTAFGLVNSTCKERRFADLQMPAPMQQHDEKFDDRKAGCLEAYHVNF